MRAQRRQSILHNKFFFFLFCSVRFSLWEFETSAQHSFSHCHTTIELNSRNKDWKHWRLKTRTVSRPSNQPSSQPALTTSIYNFVRTKWQRSDAERNHLNWSHGIHTHTHRWIKSIEMDENYAVHKLLSGDQHILLICTKRRNASVNTCSAEL